MLKDKTLTYISLFSCAGVGCFGFKKAGFECKATNELIVRRMNVQSLMTNVNSILDTSVTI